MFALLEIMSKTVRLIYIKMVFISMMWVITDTIGTIIIIGTLRKLKIINVISSLHVPVY
jgi:hypothetical protein